MAEFNTVGLEDIIQSFERREQATVKAVPEMLKAGAEVLVQAQKEEAEAMGLNETGGFINSIKATPVKKSGAETYIEVYPQGRAPHGNDRKEIKATCAMLPLVLRRNTEPAARKPGRTNRLQMKKQRRR